MIFLKHHSVTSVSINQKKVMHPASLTPDVAFKTTQRDGMGREERGGFRMGNTCKPVADSF